MDFNQLRQKHSTLTYKSFSYHIHKNTLAIKFHFHLAPDINFYPTVEIPLPEKWHGNLDVFVFNLGMVELISYWKAACPKHIVVEAGQLSTWERIWWKDLYINGLGEFFYVNNINPLAADLLTISPAASGKKFSAKPKKLAGSMVLVGGGKDSVVTAEMLGKAPEGSTALMLNPTKAAKKVAKLAGFSRIIVGNRTIDQTLLELNQQGYLNGHTPFSAYLAFFSSLVAYIYGIKDVIVSNESSAGEGSFEYRGITVNHQYSKSFRYEKKFRQFCSKHFPGVNYFSFLRPLNELQITALFCTSSNYDTVFNSCNRGRGDYWCGECPKCAFTFLMFSALTNKSRVLKIFKEDLFEKPRIRKYIKNLTGEIGHKPLDCVGTEKESRLAVRLIDEPDNEKLLQAIKDEWSHEHFLPEKYEKILKSRIEMINHAPTKNGRNTRK